MYRPIDDKVKLERIEICSRVDLIIANEGFDFVSAGGTTDRLEHWDNWGEYWPLYRKDNISEKVWNWFHNLPEHKAIRLNAAVSAMYFDDRGRTPFVIDADTLAQGNNINNA